MSWMNIIRRMILGLIVLLGLAVSVVLSIIGYLVFSDYNPDQVENVELVNNPSKMIKVSEPLTFYSWNIGYCGLGKDEDFFMDGGHNSRPKDITVVERYLNGVTHFIEQVDADFIMLQEIDIDSKRTYGINEKKEIDNLLSEYNNSFGKNYDVSYVPRMGRVESGIGSYSKYNIQDVKRYTLPGEFGWPNKYFMLDRCMLVSRLPIIASTSELIIINTHFSAYDDGSIRAQQLDFLKEFILQEYKKGNYIVVGGDWNQTFPGVDTSSTIWYKADKVWEPYQIADDWIDDGWTFAYGSGTPTYRFLNAPYEKGITQTGIIDGFLFSPNISLIKSKVIDMEFEFSDHQPVFVEIILN